MIFKLLFFAVFLFQNGSGEIRTDSTVEETSRDSIQTEMVLRSEDLLWQTSWNFFSIDRMSYKVNSGPYGYYGPQPAYMLDGIPFDPAFFGMNFSQLMPVSFNQIHKLNTEQGIGMKDGIGYSSGLLNIQSVPVKEGLSVYASGQYGHNSDEPGPWVFDPEQVSPNVERFGPWVDAGISLKLGSWYAKSLFRGHSYLNINPFLQLRIKNLVANPEENNWPDGNANARLGLVETGVKSKYVDFKVQGIRSESEDFIFFQPLAREIPSEFRMEQYSARGTFSLSNLIGIRTLAQYRKKDTDYRKNQLKHEFDWQQIRKSARASVFLHSDRFKFDLGTEYRKVETSGRGLPGENRVYTDLFLDQQVNITDRFRFGTYSEITLHEDERAIRAKAFTEIDVTKGWTTALEGSYSELLPEVSNPLDKWVTDGYDLLSRLDIFTFVPDQFSNTELITLSHRHQFQLSNSVDAEAGVTYLDHRSFHIPFQSALYNFTYSTTPGIYFLFVENSGKRLHLSLDSDIQWSGSFKQSLGVYWNNTLEGDDPYQVYWKTVPQYLIRHSSIYTPFPDLNIQLNVQYQAGSVWEEFRQLEGELNRTFHVQFPFRFFRYDHKIPAGVNIDLVLSKWFWEQRVRTVLMLSNLFNQKYQTHPIGSLEGFGYMLRLELRF